MSVEILQGDCIEVLRGLPSESVHCCVTSPPYWGLRDYGTEGQMGLEPTPEEYIARMVAVFHEVKRVLRADGTCWVNMGDSYNAYNGGAGPSSALSRGAQTTQRPQLETGYGLRCSSLKPKDLCGIPWMLAFALRADGWYLRSDIIWAKPNPMPESVTDRPTKSHEYLFLLSKSQTYYYDAEAIAEPANWPEGSWARSKAYDGDETGKLRSFYGNGARWEGGETRNKRTVWTVATQPTPDAHFATFPEELIKPCILAGCPAGGIVLDPFFGSGTTGIVARMNGCNAIGIELNPTYIEIARKKLSQEVFEFG